ncbi:hypothetical protein L596_022118 [Steinernema carpocapsae]|uniref:CCN TSP1 domain-containing protein n=1 Tax=Steinernema carpocapsae TaxID=34508 RepID=A0A4U5MKS0_STECR|nr:hypothetical protein L596_022118 [Steinernema carpocapsae]
MPVILPLIIILHVLSISLSQTSSKCQWLPWSAWSDCTDTCGSCGIHIRTRTCLTNNGRCECDGSGTQVDYCSLEVCLHPRKTCCFDTRVAVKDRKFICVPSDGGFLVPLFN